jgi:hypothetical protein
LEVANCAGEYDVLLIRRSGICGRGLLHFFPVLIEHAQFFLQFGLMNQKEKSG